MLPCGCFLLAAIVAALVYTVMHGMWLAVSGIFAVTALIAWFVRKAAIARKATQK